MSIKEIKEAVDNNRVYIGIKESLKNKKDIQSSFMAKDSRDSTVNKLKEEGINFTILKFKKSEISKQLDLNFYSEIFSIKK
jgi:SUMO ligase MMS21 Smc5/6 complex component